MTKLELAYEKWELESGIIFKFLFRYFICPLIGHEMGYEFIEGAGNGWCIMCGRKKP